MPQSSRAADGSEHIWPDEQKVKRRQVRHEDCQQGLENNETNPKRELGRPTSACEGPLASTLNNSVLPMVLTKALTSRRLNAAPYSQNISISASIHAVQAHAHLSNASVICPLSEPYD